MWCVRYFFICALLLIYWHKHDKNFLLLVTSINSWLASTRNEWKKNAIFKLVVKIGPNYSVSIFFLFGVVVILFIVVIFFLFNSAKSIYFSCLRFLTHSSRILFEMSQEKGDETTFVPKIRLQQQVCRRINCHYINLRMHILWFDWIFTTKSSFCLLFFFTLRVIELINQHRKVNNIHKPNLISKLFN